MQRLGLISILLLSLSLFSSCSDDDSLRIVVSKNDPNYNQAAELIAAAFRRNGYEVQVNQTDNTLEATALVAAGKADLKNRANLVLLD